MPVHFPIALLLGAPILAVIRRIARKAGTPFLLSARVVVVCGTTAAFTAVETGAKAAALVLRTGGVGAVLERHEDHAETTLTVFVVLTIVFAVMAIGPVLLPKPIKRPLVVAALVRFHLLYIAGTVVLANTAHHGGRLVHEFGVTAMIPIGGDRPARPDDRRPSRRVARSNPVGSLAIVTGVPGPSVTRDTDKPG